MKDYPKHQRKTKGKQAESNQGRVYTMSAKKVKEGNNLMTGTGFISSNPIVIFYDSGAMHSFISCKNAQRMQLSLSSLPFQLHIHTPTEGSVTTSLLYKNYPLTIEGRDFIIDLVCFPMKGMDIILGMDWITANQVVLDCFNRTIQFSSESSIPSRVSFNSLTTIAGLNQCLMEGAA